MLLYKSHAEINHALSQTLYANLLKICLREICLDRQYYYGIASLY